MMRRIVTTFGGASYDKTLAITAERAHRLGATEPAWIYDEPWMMGTDFYRDNQWAWEHPGHNGQKYGWGWYIWKPYVIRHAMSKLDDGDILLWLDGDTYPMADFSCLYDYCRFDGGSFLFEATGCKDVQWCKRDVWSALFGMVDDCQGEIPLFPVDSQHATARFMLFEKGAPLVHSFLLDWQRICCIPGITTRDPSTSGPEFPGFEENRGDQSVFSLLSHKYGIPLHREADAFGECSSKDRDLYGQLFEQLYCSGDRNDLSGSKYRRIPE